MLDHIKELIVRYKNKGILVDTNVLLLYLVGKYDRSRIKKFDRTAKFSERDYEILSEILESFEKVVTTPNILTEVGNLSNKLKDDVRLEYYNVFSNYISDSDELYIESKKICSLDYFQKFGLTDCGIINLVQGKYLVITDEFHLTKYLEKNNIDVINFTQLLPYYWNE